MTRLAAAVAAMVAACSATVEPAVAQDGGSAAAIAAGAQRSLDALTVPPSLDRPPSGYSRTAKQVSRTAGRVAKIRAERVGRRNTYARAYLKGPPRAGRWLVSSYAPAAKSDTPNEQIGQVLIDDRAGNVIEAWTGPQVAWTMARGYPGAFGRKVNAPWPA